MPPEQIVEKILRCREYLEDAAKRNNDQQVLSVLEKLDKLPISLDHLQETGIGKTVNGYRKCNDPVGKKAKSIVNKWKGLVQAAIAEESFQRSCDSPENVEKESENVSREDASESSSYVSLELRNDVGQKKKGNECKDLSTVKYNETQRKRHSDYEEDAPPMKKHSEHYSRDSDFKSLRDDSQINEIKSDCVKSKDAAHWKATDSNSSKNVQSREAKSSSHSSKRKDQQRDSQGQVKSDASRSLNKDAIHRPSYKEKTSALSNHEDSSQVISYTKDKAKQQESNVKRKWNNDNDGEGSSKKQHFELSSDLDEEEISPMEKNPLQNRETSDSSPRIDMHGASSVQKNMLQDKSSSSKHKSERESSSGKLSSGVKSSSHKDSNRDSSSKTKHSSDKHLTVRDSTHQRATERTVPDGSLNNKHLSQKKSSENSCSLKADSSVKDSSGEGLSMDQPCKLSSVKIANYKNLSTLDENEDRSSHKNSIDKHLLFKESLDKLEESSDKDFIQKDDCRSSSKSSSKGSTVSKSVERELVKEQTGKSNFKDVKKHHGDRSSGKNKSMNSKPIDDENYDLGGENIGQLFPEDLLKPDSKSSPGQRKHEAHVSGASKSSTSRSKLSKNYSDDHRSSNHSVSLGSCDSLEKVRSNHHNSSVAKKKMPENEAKASQKNLEKRKSDQNSTPDRNDVSKSSGIHSRKSDKSNSRSSKILDKKSETRDSSAGRVKFSDAIDDELDLDNDDSNGMSFEACLNYDTPTAQKKSSAKSGKSLNVEIREKHENKTYSCRAEQPSESRLNQSLINVPLPKEFELDLEHDDLPLYPSMRQEFQSKTSAAEKSSNLERRYGQKMIYSGRKQATVPVAVHSLFDACIQVLQENVDDITYTGDIPADVLMPVLKACNVVQLERLEFYNPHFVGDTEELWKIHCNRDFRGDEPEDMESWRELYMRLQDARNERLAKISRNVMANKMRADKEVSRVQLTYVDSTPNRGNRSKNNFFSGASGSTVCTEETGQPRSKQEILDSLKSQISKPPQRRRGGWGAPKTEQKSVAKPAAPLMQKTLQFLKKLRR